MNIFVGNLAFEATPEGLKKTFEEFGEVSIVKIMMNDKGTKSRGFAFLEMPDELEARKAIGALNGSEFIGRRLVVGVARPRPGAAQEKPKVKKHRGNLRVRGNPRAADRERYPGYGEGGGYKGGKRIRGRTGGGSYEAQEQIRPDGHFKPGGRPFGRGRPAGKSMGGPYKPAEANSRRPWKKREESADSFRRAGYQGAERKERGRSVKPWERAASVPGKRPFRPARREEGSPARDDRNAKPWRRPAVERPSGSWRGKDDRSGRPQRPWKKREESAGPFRRAGHQGAERKERGRSVKPWERAAPVSGKRPFRPARREEGSPARDDRNAKPWRRPAGERPSGPWQRNDKRRTVKPGRPGQRSFRREDRARSR